MLKVIENRILVEPIPEDQTSKQGIILETVKEKPMTGVVVAVGLGRSMENGSREHMDVKEGDLVFFTKYAPDEFTYQDKTYYSIQQSSILAIEPEGKFSSEDIKKMKVHSARSTENIL